MAGDLVQVKEEKGIFLITICHPPVNALNEKVLSFLSQIIASLEERRDDLVVIITGSGNRAFIGGADIKEFSHLHSQGGEALSSLGQQIFGRLELLPFPVIAAINGYALGGGCELILSCDIRIMAKEARLGFPEVNLGLIPGYGGTQRLPRIIPVGKAKELIFTGEMLGAKEAQQLGLIERVVPGERLLEEAFQLAQTILKKGPLALKKAKEAILKGLELSLEEGLSLEAQLFGSLFETEDFKEGVQAFLEKRKPLFQGK